ncbi:MAG TPA: hypothetical protein PLE19_03850 [Planctomycetota bacterium]|nr:hypothetical protein [Planctomycetota bacterium]HRR78567.1 hypothetical protein [Planctomycetota bacterium]HRT97319.1 hypothetical protein [Planctomycetota bacterium]
MRMVWIAVALALGMAAASGLAAQPTEAEAENSLEAITRKLAAARMEEVNVDKKDPDAVFDLIRDRAKVNLVVDPEARRQLEGKSVSLKLRGVTALSVLQHVLRQVDCVTAYADEALVVTTAAAAQPHPQITIYDIRDMTIAPKGSRLPPTLFGSQIDPLYYYWIRTQLGPTTGGPGVRDPFWELELIDKYPDDPIGEVIARTIQEKFKGTGVSVSYYDGYLVVVEQPKAARVPVLPPPLPETPKDALPAK